MFIGRIAPRAVRTLTIALPGVLCSAAPAGAQNPMVDRVGTTGFLQLQADSFQSLSPREQALGYWLSEAAIAIHPIIFDQLSRFGLRQKRVLEMIVAHPSDVDRAAYPKILAFTKLFWANRGNHNETTAQKFLPDFTFEELRTAGLAVIKHGGSWFHRSGFLERDRRAETVSVRSEFRAHDDRQKPRAAA